MNIKMPLPFTIKRDKEEKEIFMEEDLPGD
jgi:hypothetical protein